MKARSKCEAHCWLGILGKSHRLCQHQTVKTHSIKWGFQNSCKGSRVSCNVHYKMLPTLKYLNCKEAIDLDEFDWEIPTDGCLRRGNFYFDVNIWSYSSGHTKSLWMRETFTWRSLSLATRQELGWNRVPNAVISALLLTPISLVAFKK